LELAPGGHIVPNKEILLTNLFIFQMRLPSKKRKKKDISFHKLIIRKISGTSAWRAHCSQEINIAYQFIYFLNEIIFEKKKEKGY
jgi:hypothetical protein